MIIDGIFIYAEPRKTLYRLYDGAFVGIEYSLGYVYYKNGVKLDEPYLETPNDFTELDESGAKDALHYGEFVDKRVREHYSVADELAIQRQRDTKPEAFDEYFVYCEECKKKALDDIGWRDIEFAS